MVLNRSSHLQLVKIDDSILKCYKFQVLQEFVTSRSRDLEHVRDRCDDHDIEEVGKTENEILWKFFNLARDK